MIETNFNFETNAKRGDPDSPPPNNTNRGNISQVSLYYTDPNPTKYSIK